MIGVERKKSDEIERNSDSDNRDGIVSGSAFPIGENRFFETCFEKIVRFPQHYDRDKTGNLTQQDADDAPL